MFDFVSKKGESRPLSPHLFVYKFEITSSFSIFHRFTGVFLYFFFLMIVAGLFCNTFFSSEFPILILAYLKSVILGKFVFFVTSIMLFYHFLNGIRHLLWDAMAVMRISDVRKSAMLILLLLFVFSIYSFYYFFIS